MDGSLVGRLLPSVPSPTFVLSPPHHLMLMMMTSQIAARLTKHILSVISLVSHSNYGR